MGYKGIFLNLSDPFSPIVTVEMTNMDISILAVAMDMFLISMFQSS